MGGGTSSEPGEKKSKENIGPGLLEICTHFLSHASFVTSNKSTNQICNILMEKVLSTECPS